jgi:hypothetical protein
MKKGKESLLKTNSGTDNEAISKLLNNNKNEIFLIANEYAKCNASLVAMQENLSFFENIAIDALNGFFIIFFIIYLFFYCFFFLNYLLFI